MARLRVQEVQPVQEMLARGVEVQEGKIYVSNIKLAPDLRQEIGEAQWKDSDFQVFKTKILEKKDSDFQEGENRTLYFHDRICVPNDGDLRKQILEEAHKNRYTMHRGKNVPGLEKSLLVA
jgi:hypothetical protein